MLIPPACICEDAPGTFGMLLVRDPECPAHGDFIRGVITVGEGLVDEDALRRAGYKIRRHGSVLPDVADDKASAGGDS